MNVRNKELLSRFANHSMKANFEKAIEATERFAAAAQRIKSNRDLSDQGREKEVHAQARSALRDLRDLSAPVDAMRARRAQLADGVKHPVFDKTDFAGAVRRAELRSVVASQTMVKRLELLTDPDFRAAVLEQPALASGFSQVGELDAFARAKATQLEEIHAPVLREIEALDEEIAAADAVITLARNDLKQEMKLDDRAFDQFARPIETRLNAPWLKRSKDLDGVERVVRIMSAEAGFDGKSPAARLATPDEVRDGKFYENVDEYRADRAA